jgi:hypothetical protein
MAPKPADTRTYLRFHEGVRRRNAKWRDLKRLLRQLGIRVPKHPRRTARRGETYAVMTILTLIRQFGREPVIMALRLINETGGGNAGELRAATITAVTILLHRHPDWGQLGLALFDAFDRIDLPFLRGMARQLELRHHGSTSILIGLMAGRLITELGDLA